MNTLHSILFVPAANARAVEKAASLASDAVILDLEDSAGPEKKAEARAAAKSALTAGAFGRKAAALRINGGYSEWFAHDIVAAAKCGAAVVLPKVSGAGDLQDARGALDAAGGDNPLWAMIETPLALMNLKQIGEAAQATGLAALIVGPNDLSAALRLPAGTGREGLVPHLARIVAAARAYGLAVYDGVYNDVRDTDGFAAEARTARMLGFDGKTLIHPGQIAPTNEIFGPTPQEIAWARRVVQAFAAPEARGQGAIALDGKMIERMHLTEAEHVLARAAALRAK